MLLTFLLDPRAVLMDRQTASGLRLAAGALIGTSRGRFGSWAPFRARPRKPLILMDIGHAQRLFGLEGRVDRVDLVLGDEASFLSRLREASGSSLQQKERMYAGMLEAFRLNLEALSLIALFVGVFLIYNTAMFTMVSRRKDAAILRSLGASRTEIACAFLAEVLIFGLAGGLLGGLFGYGLSRSLTGLVGQTISNLYFFLKPSPLPWSWWLVAAGVLFGCSSGVLGSLFPLFDLVRLNVVSAFKEEPRGADHRCHEAHGSPGRSHPRPHPRAPLSLVPPRLRRLRRRLCVPLRLEPLYGLCSGPRRSPAQEKPFLYGGPPGRIAAGNIRQNLSRTAVAVAAFMVALSMSVGLGSMIGSFRESLIWWMGTQLRADIYIGSTSEGFEVPERFYRELTAMPGLAGVDPYRNTQLLYEGRSISVAAVSADVLQKYTHFGWLKGGNEHWDG